MEHKMNPIYIVRNIINLFEAYHALPEERQVETPQAFVHRILLPPLSFSSLPVAEQLEIQAYEQFALSINDITKGNNRNKKNMTGENNSAINGDRDVTGVSLVAKNNANGNNNSVIGAIGQTSNSSGNMKKPKTTRKDRPPPEEVDFIGEVVAGVCRYYDICHALFVGFCNGFRRSTTQDKSAMVLISYLLLYRFEELGPSILFPMMQSTDIPQIRLTEFIAFISSIDMLKGYAATLWISIVQDEYIYDFLIPTLERNGKEMLDNVPQLRSMMTSSIGTECEYGNNINNDSKDDYISSRNEDYEHVTDAGIISKGIKHTMGGSSPLLDNNNNNNNDSNNNNTDVSTAEHHHSSIEATHTTTTDSAVKLPLPPIDVREMVHTIPLKKPSEIKITNATMEERRAVEAAKYGIKLSTLNEQIRKENRKKEASKPFYPFTSVDRPSKRLSQRENSEQCKESDDIIEKKPTIVVPVSGYRYAVVPSVEEVKKKLKDIVNVVKYKTTEAAILREKLLLDNKRDAEEAALAEKVRNLYDETEFEQWRAMAREKDEADRLLKVKERKLMMMMADENARQAKAIQQDKNHKLIKVIKENLNKNKETHQREVENETKHKIERAAEQRITIEQGLTNAISLKRKKNKESVAMIKQEKRELNTKVAIETEQDREKKVTLINAIKKAQKESAEMRKVAILEKQKKNYEIFHSFSDENSENSNNNNNNIMNARMLSTMTIAELHRFYELQLKERSALIEDKRRAIQEEKLKKNEAIRQMQIEIESHRNELKTERETHRMQKRELKQTAEEAARAEEEKRIFEIQRKLDEKRNKRKAEQTRFKEEEKKRIIKAQLLTNDFQTVQKRNFANMEKASENTVIRAQNQRLKDKQCKRAISASEEKRRETNYDAQYNSAVAVREHSDDILEKKKTLMIEEERAMNSAVQRMLLDGIGQERGR